MRKDFTAEERVAIAKAVEAEIGNRQGSNQHKAKGELPQNLAEAKGTETRKIAAEKAGFGNAETYRQTKAVTETAEPVHNEMVDRTKLGDVEPIGGYSFQTYQEPAPSVCVNALKMV